MSRFSRPAFVPVLLLPLALAAPAAPIAPVEVHKTLPLRADGLVELKTYKGSIVVTPGTGDEVVVSARIVPDGDDRDMAEAVRDTRVEVTGGGDAVRIESDYSRVRGRHWFLSFGHGTTLPFVKYEIRVPAGARLVVKDYKSAIRVEGLSGNLELDTYKGDARLERLAGRARVETYKGEVTASFARLAGDSRFHTYKGTYVLSLPSGAAFDLHAETGRRGDFECDFPLETRARWRQGEEVRAAVNGGGPRIDISTHRGRIALRKG